MEQNKVRWNCSEQIESFVFCLRDFGTTLVYMLSIYEGTAIVMNWRTLLW